MKRTVLIIFSIIVSLSLIACGNTANELSMYIEKTELTEEEDNIVTLLGAQNKQHIYDFKLDNSVKSIQVNSYELINGEWNLVSGGGGIAFTDSEGRLALGFANLAEGLRVAIQSDNNSGSTEYSNDIEEDTSGILRATSTLNKNVEISYEQEIPLVLQVLTTGNSANSFDVEYFFNPDIYDNHDYEHIYAITIRFSQKTVNELDQIQP